MKTDKNVTINEQVFPMGTVGIAATYFLILITLKKYTKPNPGVECHSTRLLRWQ